MEVLYRCFSGALLSLLSLFAPIGELVFCALLFIVIDFITGVLADRKQALREGREWFFESGLARLTIRKAALTILTIAMARLLDCWVLPPLQLNLAKLFTGFVCGVEFWSFLENAAQLSEDPIFRWLRRYARRRVGKEVKW